MDLQCDQVKLPSRRRLKIRRAPSSKLSASTSSSFHGTCSQKQKGRCSKKIVIQPLIFHTVDPEIMKIEPAEFMCVVQRLTGSPDTRRSVRMWMRKSKEVESSLQAVQEMQLMQQGMHSMQQSNNDLLLEGTTTIIAPAAFMNANLSINDLPPSPSSPNPSGLNKNINHPPELPLISNSTDCSHPTPLLSDTINLINLKTNHPNSSSFSSNFAILDEENTSHPLSPMSSSKCAIKSSKDSSQCLPLISPKYSPSIIPLALPLTAKHSDLPLSPNASKCRGTNHLVASPLYAQASDELSNSRCSPLSPHSSLTTSSEGYHTDNLSTEDGAWEALCFEPCNSREADQEDGSINFFDFSLDSYYGNYNAAQDEMEFYHSHVLDPFYHQ